MSDNNATAERPNFNVLGSTAGAFDVELKRQPDPLRINTDAHALNTLVAVPKHERETLSQTSQREIPMMTSAEVDVAANESLYNQQSKPATEAPVAAAPVPVPQRQNLIARKLVFTGRIASGKDYVAEQIGAKVIGFEEPLRYLVELFFGVNTSPDGKGRAGALQFVQQVAAWGRAEVSEAYPLTPARACFTTMIQAAGRSASLNTSLLVDWENFGKHPGLWVTSLIGRAERFLLDNKTQRVVVSGVRSEYEFRQLSVAGFGHYHVMCSPQTWQQRLRARNLTDKSSAVVDVSERLAQALDNNVIKQISAQKSGNRLHCIWNDSLPAPSGRFYSVATLRQDCAIEDSATQGAVYE